MGNEFTVNPSMESGTVYAKWILDVGSIQNFTNAQCQSLASDTEVLATDLRDNNQYTLRYINGNCWMTQNLRLAGGTVLTPLDSNVTSNYTIPTTPFEGNAESLTEGRVQISSYSDYGGYYNYCAASAGTVCIDSNEILDTPSDICPANWHLPTLSEAENLTGNTLEDHYAAGAVFMPTYGSSYYSRNELSNGYDARYWTSTMADTINNTVELRYHYFISTVNAVGVHVSNNMFRRDGFHIRCVLTQ